MDKIVKHRFWILLALVPPLVVFGYYKANGAIKAATTARISALDTALSGIPKGDGPNPTWVKGADGGIELYNEAISKAVNVEKVRVWTDQLPRLTWPPEMEPYIPRTPQGDMIYRGEFVSEAGYTYTAEYVDQLEALYQSIEPLKQERDGGVSGKVQLSRNIIPRHKFPQMLVKSEAIWDAQEDLWLLQVLFDAVRNANRPAENAAKSAVRRLNSIRLMGGDGQSTIRSMGGTGAAGGDGGRMLGMGVDDEDASAGLAATMMSRGGSMGMGQRTNVSFDPSEEFGIGFEGMGGGTGGAAAEGGFGGGRDIDNDMGTAVAGGMAGAMGGMGRKEIRYIQYTEGAPFRERGFYMSVLIDQKKIADFLVELSNADWPIRIVRFNVGQSTGATGTYNSPGGYLGGGKGRDMDDAASMMPGMGPLAGGGLFDEAADSGAGFGGNQFDTAASGFSDELFNNPLMGGDTDDLDARMGLGGAAGAYGPTPLVRGDQIQSLFTHPDLVQLDVCGAITMYNPPDPALYAAVTGKPAPDPAAAAPAADGTTAPAGDAAGAAEAPADAGVAQPATLGAATVDPADADAGSDSAATPDAGAAPDPSTPPASEGATPAEASDAPTEPPAAEATTPAPGA